MATLKNLNNNDVAELKELFEKKIQPENPLATLQIHKEQDDNSQVSLMDLRNQVVELKVMLNNIFDGHVLINEKWVDTKKLLNKKI